MKFKSEQLAYWYLRLNGFLTIQNFIVHPDKGVEQRTDADIIGVRFPYRAELQQVRMRDDELFAKVKDKPFVVIAEVKRNICDLNGPWTEPQKENLQRVLRALGMFPSHEIETAAREIYTSGTYFATRYQISLICFGKSRNNKLAERFQNVPQVLWDQVLGFIYIRFRTYKTQKASHGQWDKAGQRLWEAVWQNNTMDEFRKAITIQ